MNRKSSASGGHVPVRSGACPTALMVASTTFISRLSPQPHSTSCPADRCCCTKAHRVSTTPGQQVSTPVLLHSLTASANTPDVCGSRPSGCCRSSLCSSRCRRRAAASGWCRRAAQLSRAVQVCDHKELEAAVTAGSVQSITCAWQQWMVLIEQC